MTSEGEQSYKVFFASNVLADVGPGTILVAPRDGSWNDFGFQVRVEIKVRPRSDDQHRRDALFLLGFLGFAKPRERSQDTRALQQLLAADSRRHLPAEDVPDFFTMLPDMAAYREIVTLFGSSEAKKVLKALCDVVEAENASAVRPWLRAATASPVFRQAFLRTTEAFFAWKNAGMILRGVEFEQLGRISEEIRIEFQLAGRPNPHRLRFRFSLHEDVLPKRFAIVIGKNGVGKSQTLGRIAAAAVRGLNTLTDGEGGRPVFNRILAFHPATAGSETFPAEWRSRSRVWYRRFPLGGAGRGRHRQMTGDLIVQLARTAERIGAANRFEIFMNGIRAIEGHEQLALITKDAVQPLIFLERLQSGGEQTLLDRFASIDVHREVVRVIDGEAYSLSSGELGFVRFAALAALHIENSSLLLFDEPETHLHPNFISQFVAVLDGLLAQTGSAAIIATHSVYFVREAFEDQVTVLRSGPDRSIAIETPHLRTFGADVGAISYFVFGEDEPSRLAREVERQIVREANTWEEVFAAYKDHLSLDLLGEIRAEIEGRNGTAPRQ